MLEANKLTEFVRVPSLVGPVILQGPNAVVSRDLILRHKQIDQASILIVELDIVSILEVVGDRVFIVRVYKAVNEVKVGVKAFAREL